MAWLGLLVLCLGALFILLGFAFPLNDRINILVMGLDRRPGEGDAVRADAIMVITANPGVPDLGLLSIPRDLYLFIPEQGENRINTAHIFGELERPGGGPRRTAAAITQNFGIPLGGWVRVDFHGFVELVDALGGIEIDVPVAVIDHAYPTEDYGTMTLSIPAGVQQMDGERTLQYARSRHSSSDFDRAERQQLVVRAMAHKLAEPSTWRRLPALYTVFDTAVETNLSTLQLARLGLATLRVGSEGIQHLVIDQDLVDPHVTPAGAAVLLPRWELIRPMVARVFDPE